MNPIRAIDRLFYAVFGQTRNVDLMVMLPAEKHPDWTKVLFKIVFGVYMLVTVVVLVKLLIATMSDTYQQIQAQSDIEWKFGLSKLVRNIHRSTTAPSPINLITTWFFYIKNIIVQKVLYLRWHKLSATSKAGEKWLKKIKRTNSTSKTFYTTFDSQISYEIHQKSIENVLDWETVAKQFRKIMVVKAKEIKSAKRSDKILANKKKLTKKN